MTTALLEIDDGLNLELLPAEGYEVAYVTHKWSFGFAFDSQTGTHALGTSRKCAYRRWPNSLSVWAPDQHIYSQSRDGGEYLLLSVSDRLAEKLKLSDRTQITDPIVRPKLIRPADTIRKGLLSDDASPMDQLRSQAWSFLDHAVESCHVDLQRDRAQNLVTPERLRRVDEHIDAHLENGLSVDTLARSLGLSTGFFIRMFKRGTGFTPHRYIMARRIMHARRRIQQTETPLAEIASACGFSSQSHMTNSFRERLGITPAALRMTAM